MKCTCGAKVVQSAKHSDWCDSLKHIYTTIAKDMTKANIRCLFITKAVSSLVYEELKEEFKPSWLMCMDFSGGRSIIFKNGSELYFVDKHELNNEHLINFDGAYVSKDLENENFDKYLKPLAPVKYVDNSGICN